MNPTQATVHIGFGEVRHRRLRPREHAFKAKTMFLLIPMRTWGHDQARSWIQRNRWSALSFYDRDHGEGGNDALAWVETVLAQHGVHDACGQLWLQTYPRVWGYAFKPVSFWYAHRADGSLAAVVAEVNNTFGQRHSYVLTEQPAWGRELKADKVFEVSPFCTVEGHYRFRFMRRMDAVGQIQRLVSRVDYDDAQGALLETSVSGTLVPLSASSYRQALWSSCWVGLGLSARILWQAAQLWRKRVPWARTSPTSHPMAIR